MGYLLNTNVSGVCSHGGSAQAIAASPRVKAGGAAVLTVSNQLAVSGCTNQVSGAPVPCVISMFVVGASRVKAGGQPVLLDTSTPTNIPTGATTTIINTQVRVKGT